MGLRHREESRKLSTRRGYSYVFVDFYGLTLLHDVDRKNNVLASEVGKTCRAWRLALEIMLEPADIAQSHIFTGKALSEL